MKKPTRRTIRHHGYTRLGLALLCGCVASGTAWPAEEPSEPAEPAEPAEEPATDTEASDAFDPLEELDYRNWFTVSAGGLFTHGNQAAAQQRLQRPGEAFGGVDEFHFEQDIGRQGLFTADGRGLFDHHDYSIKLELVHPDIGFLRAGYREYRTWYDGHGGFFPLTGAWYSPYDQEFSLDRGAVWFEGGLTLPKVPRVSFGYRHEFRDGLKDSTSWGLSTQAGAARGIVPSFLDLDEDRHIFTGDVKHRIGKTDLGVGLRYENSSIDNGRYLRQNPGEPSDARVTQRETIDTDLFNVHASSETRFNDKTLLTLGYAFTDLDTDLGGYRVYGTGYDPDLAQRLPNANTFEQLSGGSQLRQHLINLNLMWLPWTPLAVIPSVRIEKQDLEGLSQVSLPAAPFTPFLYDAFNERGLLRVSENLEVRYTGVTNVVLYTRGHWLQGSGDLEETSNNASLRSNALRRSTDDRQFAQKYSAGARWYPVRRLNFASEYYHKLRENDFEHRLDTTANVPASLNRYPAFLQAHEYTTDDVNFRVSWRPLSALSLVARYDFQRSTIDTQPDQLAQLQSAELTSHILSGSASWIPWSRLYLQGTVNYVMDQTDTPVDEILAAVQRSENDYWTATATAGFVLDNRTDLEAQYFYYRADNYADNSAFGVPYNASLEEHGITAGITRRMTKHMRLSLRYGFFTSADTTAGGYRDYDAHMVYSSMQYRF
ncbi:MAG: TonB-dependent receptor [Verrucomicrobia bacterium]|nr:TonB-dependent receptor [Verrucomicrobiota bacterium]